MTPIMTMEDQVKSICRTCNALLMQIRRIRPHLTQYTALTLVKTLVLSRIDLNNALLCNINSRLLDQLQAIQRFAVRVICNLRKFDHVTAHMRELHILPIEHRIKYKLLLLSWKIVNSQAPTYLTSMFTEKHHSYSTRAIAANRLFEPKARYKTIGDRAFSVAAPRLWNTCDPRLKSIKTLEPFKKQLKTTLFREAYLS